MTFSSLTIVGAVGTPADVIADVTVSRLLKSPPITLTHGAAFTGRPGTRIHADDSWVLKLRMDHDFTLEKTAVQWVRHRLRQERDLGIYHPSRTWFVLTLDGVIRCGNISCRLTPLHDNAEQITAEQPTHFLDCVTQLFRLYLRTALRHEMRLDEGLSNFGGDGTGALFYLDDDLYAWDQFIALAAMLAVWLRRYDGLDAGMAQHIGRQLHDALAENGLGDMAIRQVQEHLKDQFVAEPLKDKMRALIAGVGGGKRERSVEDGGNTERMIHLLDGAEGERPVALLADIHSNLPALQAVLDYLALRKVEHILVLGDTLGYGPHPKECIAALRAVGAVCLLGNHENALSQNNLQPISSRSGRWVLEWTQPRLDHDERQWLGTLSPRLTGQGWMAVHGAPMDPSFFNAYVYEMTYEDNLDWMEKHGMTICFHGHNHLQGVYARGRGMDRLIRKDKIDLSTFEHVLVGPGSVGQPRSQHPGADFALYYPQSRRVEMQHIDYDMSALLEEMRAAAFPDQLTQRLLNGR